MKKLIEMWREYQAFVTMDSAAHQGRFAWNR